MGMMIVVFVGTIKRWFELLQVKERVRDVWGDTVIAPIEGEMCLIPTEPEKSLQAKSAEEKWMG